MTTQTTTANWAVVLRADWERACDHLRAGYETSQADLKAEQAAYDALVDYVEENGLTGSECDPRTLPI